jgi:hypothetical protein
MSRLIAKNRSRRRLIVGLAGVGILVAILVVTLVAPAVAGRGTQPVLTGQVTGAGSVPLRDVHVQVMSGSTVVARGETNREGL